MKEISKEFYFRNLHNDMEWKRKLDGLRENGWVIVTTKPIGEYSIKLKCVRK